MSDGVGGCWGVDNMDRALGLHHYGETFRPNRYDLALGRPRPIIIEATGRIKRR